MSWLLGAKRKIPHYDIASHVQRVVKEKNGAKPLFLAATDDIFIAAGGLKETCMSSIAAAPHITSQGWIVCGLGIYCRENSCSLMNESSWDAVLGRQPLDRKNLNGYYAAATWSKEGIDLYTDALNMRRLYILETPDAFYFSTRVDWLLQFNKNNSIDFTGLKRFGHLRFSDTNNTLIKNCIQLGPAGHAAIKNGVTCTSQHWLPSEKITNADYALCENLLDRFITLPFQAGHRVAVGFTGGIDSRTLFSLLLKHPRQSWATCTYSDPDHPDVIMSKTISDSFDVKNYFFPFQKRDTSFMLEQCREVALHSEMCYTMQIYDYLFGLHELYKDNYWLIDGGFGELMRRALGSYLLQYGKKALLAKDAAGIVKYLPSKPTPFFNHELNEQFSNASLQYLQKAIDAMPPVKEFGPANWVDLLMVRYEIPYFSSNMQGYFDARIPSFAPITQPATLNAIFSLAPSRREHSAINHYIINKNAKALTKYPFVRELTLIPYAATRNKYLAKLWTMANRTFGRQYKPTFVQNLLLSLREPVYDRLLGTGVKSYPAYEYPFIQKMITEFYEQNRMEHAALIHDWLSFDFWRESL